jgi:hypothetical protein
VRDIITKAFDQATAILRTRRTDLDQGGRLLLAQETLTADQFPAIRPVPAGLEKLFMIQHVVELMKPRAGEDYRALPALPCRFERPVPKPIHYSF